MLIFITGRQEYSSHYPHFKREIQGLERSKDLPGIPEKPCRCQDWQRDSAPDRLFPDWPPSSPSSVPNENLYKSMNLALRLTATKIHFSLVSKTSSNDLECVPTIHTVKKCCRKSRLEKWEALDTVTHEQTSEVLLFVVWPGLRSLDVISTMTKGILRKRECIWLTYSNHDLSLREVGAGT